MICIPKMVMYFINMYFIVDIFFIRKEKCVRGASVINVLLGKISCSFECEFNEVGAINLMRRYMA